MLLKGFYNAAKGQRLFERLLKACKTPFNGLQKVAEKPLKGFYKAFTMSSKRSFEGLLKGFKLFVKGL